MKHKLLFLFFCIFILVNVSFCQNNANLFLVKKTDSKNLFSLTNKNAQPIVEKNKAVYISPTMLVQPSFYCNNLSFFCRQEIKIAKVTKLPFPILFRVGSVQYVDYFEQKPNANYFNK